MRKLRAFVRNDKYPDGIMIFNDTDTIETDWSYKDGFLLNLTGDLLTSRPLGNFSYALLWARIGYNDVTVMESLDVKDACGTEAYVGDIVSLPDTDTETVDVGIGHVPVAQTHTYVYGTIVYQEGFYGVWLDVKYTETWVKGFNPLSEDIIEGMTILGNIKEDKQILETT